MQFIFTKAYVRITTVINKALYKKRRNIRIGMYNRHIIIITNYKVLCCLMNKNIPQTI